MSNPKGHDTNPTVSSAKLDRKLRLSLPEKERSPTAAGAGIRRNTISEDSLPRTRKRSKHYTPTIPEDDGENEDGAPKFVIENEIKKSQEVSRTASAASKTSAVSSRSTRSTFTYDNEAFEGNLKTTASAPRSESRTPSVRSLEVYREQYCCCAKRTKCERYLLVTVTILAIIVIVLIIVIAVLAKNGQLEGYKMFK